MIVEQPVGKGADEVHDEDVSTAGVAAEGSVSAVDDEVPAAVDKPSIPSPPPPTPPPQSSHDQPSTSHDAGILMDLLQNLLDTCTTLTRRVEHLEQDKIAQALEITKLKQKRRMISNMDIDVDVTLKDVATVAKDGQDAKMEENDEVEPTELKEVVEVVITAKLITEVVTAVAPQLTTAAPTLNTAPSTARRRKGVVIRDPEETTTPSTIIHSKAKSKDKGKGILVEELKPLKKQAQIKQDEAYARELEAELNKNIDCDETEAQPRKNMIIYLRNVAGFKMDYFKGITYDDIRQIFEKYFNSNVDFLQKTKEQMDEEDSRALKRLSESQEDKAAKKQKLDEEVEELRRHLQIVPNDEDDVYTEATPLAHKVIVVDYEIYTENNKPYYKIKRADGSHQLYLSFLNMLRNFDREDLEVLWQLVKERFAYAKPKNFFDDFLLITLGAMFEKPDIQAQIWKNQRSVHGQAKVKS
nr:hypothetical protein [Tanacetum cinerariifolium]